MAKFRQIWSHWNDHAYQPNIQLYPLTVFRSFFSAQEEKNFFVSKILPLSLGRDGGLVVSVLASYFVDPSSNPTKVYSFSLKFVFGKNENKTKRGHGYSFKNMYHISLVPTVLSINTGSTVHWGTDTLHYLKV